MKGEKLLLALVIIAFVLMAVIYLQLSQQGQGIAKRVDAFDSKISGFTLSSKTIDAQFKDVLAKVKALEDKVNSGSTQQDADKKDIMSKIDNLTSQITGMKNTISAPVSAKPVISSTPEEIKSVAPAAAVVAGNTTVELGEIPVQK
jgi:uncharacterized protein YoxC